MGVIEGRGVGELELGFGDEAAGTEATDGVRVEDGNIKGLVEVPFLLFRGVGDGDETLETERDAF